MQCFLSTFNLFFSQFHLVHCHILFKSSVRMLQEPYDLFKLRPPLVLLALEQIILKRLCSTPPCSGVVNLLCVGCALSYVLPYLCGTSLLACKKWSKLCSFTVGVVLHHLTSKYTVQAGAIHVLSPLQVVVEIPVGCEAIAHSVISLQDDTDVPPELCFILFVVFSSAFKCFLSMLAWLEGCYEKA